MQIYNKILLFKNILHFFLENTIFFLSLSIKYDVYKREAGAASRRLGATVRKRTLMR
jgi:hypothetical protein